ncbi:MAG: hypothetical protein LBE12_10995 [Planctomycetaceae bacterium]|jgi:hypothetical protein|nr:hypothetical protein [Planctomycetaceae bacterium]
MKQIYFIIFFLLAISVFGAEFYVDSESGNDTNTGTTPVLAWKSLKAVNNADLKPGDTVRFKRGGLWRGQLVPKSGNENQPIVYTSYGDSSNEKPKLLGSVPLNKPADWISEGNHLWSTRPDTIHIGNAVACFTDLVWRLHQENKAKVEQKIVAPPPQYAGKKEYQIVCSATCNASNHIQFIVAGFPVEAEKYYLLRFAAKTTKPFSITTAAFSEPDSPWAGLGNAVRLPVTIGSEWTEQEILFCCKKNYGNARFTISLGKDLPQDGEFSFIPLELCEAIVESNGINTDVGNIILNGNTAGFKKWTRENLKTQDDFWYDMKTNRVFFFSNENPAILYKNIEAALYRHIVLHNCIRYVHFIDFDVRYGAAHGFGGTKAEHCVYRDLNISWIGGADQYREGGEGRKVRFGNGIEFWSDAADCLVENCRIWEIYDAALTNQGNGINQQRNIIYRNNIIWNCEYSFEYWNREEESVTDNILFENNICFNAGFGWGHIQRPDKNGRHLMVYANTAKTGNFIIRNNIFCNATESCVRFDADFRNGLTMENNIYWQESDKPVFQWFKDQYKADRFVDYQNDVGLDKNSKLQKRSISIISLSEQNK